MAHTAVTRATALDKIRRLRAEWLAANGPCKKCGSWEELEVDHIDPATKVSHAVWSWTPERRATELAKCQALCAICHLEKTKLQFRAKGGVKRLCEKCETEFLIKPSDAKRGRGRFCSSKCSGSGPPVTTGRGGYRRPLVNSLI